MFIILKKISLLKNFISINKKNKTNQSTSINNKQFGEHWRYDEVKDYIEKKGIYKCYEKYYLVMNMAYNDYYDVAVNYGHQNDTEFFFEIAYAFINDEDAKPHKVSKYFSE